MTCSGQEWQFYMSTDLVIKNGNFILLMTCSGQVVNGNFTCLLTFSGQEWQFYITNDM